MDINYQAYNDDYQESLVDLLHYMWSSLTEDGSVSNVGVKLSSTFQEKG